MKSRDMLLTSQQRSLNRRWLRCKLRLMKVMSRVGIGMKLALRLLVSMVMRRSKSFHQVAWTKLCKRRARIKEATSMIVVSEYWWVTKLHRVVALTVKTNWLTIRKDSSVAVVMTLKFNQRHLGHLLSHWTYRSRTKACHRILLRLISLEWISQTKLWHLRSKANRWLEATITHKVVLSLTYAAQVSMDLAKNFILTRRQLLTAYNTS